MARKDVDLVIRAKDEAAKVVDTITKSLNEFIDAQSDLEGKAGKTQTALGRLGTAVGTLDKALSNLDLGSQFAPQLDRANAAIIRLEKSIESEEAAIAGMTKAHGQASYSAERMASKMDGANAAMARQKTVVQQAKTEHRELAAAYDQSAAAQARISARLASLPSLISKQADAVSKTEARYRDLALALEATDKPSVSLVNSFAASERALESQRSKLDLLTGEYAGLQSELRAVQSAVAIFGEQAEIAAGSLASQERALAKITGNYTDLVTRARSAQQAFTGLDNALDKATDSLNRQEASLERAGAEYKALAANADAFRAALAGGASSGYDALGSQLVEQGLAVQKARQEFEELSATVQRMKQDAAVIAAFRGESVEAARDIAFMGQKAEESQMKLLLQQEALERLGRAFSQTRVDIASVSQAQNTFLAEQERLAAAMGQVANEGLQQRNALRALYADTSQAEGSMRGLGNATRTAADEARKNAQATTQASQAYRALHGDTRTTLSLTQRLRGEVLSLVAAYGGLYGVISLLGQVAEAYQTIEAAQARLNVANDGDFAATANDLDYLRRTANRLGVEFGTLSTEYSKFAIATQGTALQGENTRKIFTAVAEAARVSRTSTAEMSGVFTALTQIVSKGAVQMEELRQQLGDRLPGALQIMADGLGVSTAELIKMMEAGEITEAALIPFAEELTRRFGGGLDEALAGVSTALGRLKNAAFQALLAFGNAGFIESFTNLLNDLTETIQTADFQAFIGTLSKGFATLADAAAFVARNFQLFASVAAGLIALRISPWLVSTLGSMGLLAGASAGVATSMTAAAAATTTMGAAAGGAAAATGALGRALALIRANPIGLLLSVGVGALTLWSSEADSATEALERHKSILDIVKNTYDETSGSVDEWRKKLQNLTVTEAKQNLDDLVDAAETAAAKLRVAFDSDGENATLGLVLPGSGFLYGASADYNKAVDAIITQWEAGSMTADELIAAIDDVNQKFDDGSESHKRYAKALIDAAKEVKTTETAVGEAEDVIAAMTDTTIKGQEALDELSGAAKNGAKAIDEDFNAAMETLKGTVDELKESAPETRSGIEQIADQADLLKQHYQDAVNAANMLPDAIMRAAGQQSALNTLLEGMSSLFSGLGAATGGRVTGNLFEFFKQEEGFKNTAYQDPGGVWTIGMGHTSAAGGLQVTPGLTLTDGEVVQLFEMDIAKFAARVDSAVKVPITEAMRTALISYDYNTGSIVGSEIVRLLNEGQYAAAQDALRNGINTVNGVTNSVLVGRRNREADLFGSQGLTSADIAAAAGEREVELAEEAAKAREEAAKKTAENAAEALENVEKQNAATKERLADGEFEIQQQELINAGKERQAAVEAAIREAKAENANISAEELALIGEQAGKLFDLEQAKKNSTTASEEAKKAEEEVNNLLAKRQALMQQMETATKAGDSELVTSLKAEITEVNAELTTAIDKANQLWGAVGGTEAEAAIAKLGAAKLEAENFSVAAQKNYLDWSRVADLFVNGLSGAFDTFAQAVANGENVGEAARNAFLQFAADFLRQIAQMIIQQAIFNALQGAFGGTKFGAMIGLGHTGGIVGSQRVGSGNASRMINPAIFAGAMRYHTGGIVGLAPNEVPIIAQKGEAMLTEDDPFHPANRGKLGLGGNATEVKTRIINAIDPASFLAAALASPAGEKIILNFMAANADTINSTRG